MNIRALPLALALAPAAARAACPSTPEDLAGLLDEAVAAYADLDREAFGAARDAARSSLSCLDAPLAPPQAGAYHRMEGLSGLISRDERHTLESFRASVAVEPYWEMPEELAPPGHPLRLAYEAARMAAPSDTLDVTTPGCTMLYVDGVQTTVRPRDRPAILQLAAGQGSDQPGSMLWSSYLVPPAEPPGWDTIPAIASLSCTELTASLGASSEARDRAARVLLLGAGGAAALAGGLGSWALIDRSRYNNMDFADRQEGEALRRRTNTVFFSAQASAAAALALGGAGLTLQLVW